MKKLKINPKLLFDYGASVFHNETMLPISINKLDNKYVVVLDKILLGIIYLKIKNAKMNQKIIIKHAEVLNKNGDLNTIFLRSAKATLTYICKEGNQEFSPTLTYMGFRYISIEGINIEQIEVKGIVLYSDIEQVR